jgi:hypothetical protein
MALELTANVVAGPSGESAGTADVRNTAIIIILPKNRTNFIRYRNTAQMDAIVGYGSDSDGEHSDGHTAEPAR